MPLVAAAMMPHGFPLIPVLSDDADGAMVTREAMEEVGRRFLDASVDVVVLAGPHGTRVDGAFCVMDVGRAAGTLTLRDRHVEMNVPCDRPIMDVLRQKEGDARFPMAFAGFGGNRSDQSVAPLDWGGMIPIWFLGHDQDRTGFGNVLAGVPEDDHGPPVVLITPSRSLSRNTMVEFGVGLGELFAAESRNIGFVASCDWAHTHTEDGPYGAHPKAIDVDKFVIQAVKSNDLEALLTLPEEDVADAAIDGLWQTLILAGVQNVTPLDVDVLSYEVPAYYSMIVAAYAPVGN